jgi:hypothetical protein
VIDGSALRHGSRDDGEVDPGLAERIDARAQGLRACADSLARAVCHEEPPSWGNVLDWLDTWAADMHGWASEARELAAEAEAGRF